MAVVQCLLEKADGEAVLVQTVWVPVEFGKLGKILRVRDRGGPWEDGWVVTEVYGQRDEAPEYRHLLFTCLELR